MFVIFQRLSLAILVAQSAFGYNFPYESVQLKDSDVANNSDIAFGELPGGIKAKCKTFPGDDNWPSTERWNALNVSLGGVLVKGIPPAAACYNGTYYDETKCALARRGSVSSLFAIENPVIPFQLWTLGNPCPVPQTPIPGFNVTIPQYTCNITSFPAYAVNASTVKHIQLAVNFARNNDIRISIKCSNISKQLQDFADSSRNTGHDFLGRNTGGGALQIYVHHLKALEFLPSVQIGEYEGRAARVGAAMEQYELFPFMDEHNVTLVAPGYSTVGAYGGFMQGGGLSYITGKFGLMADQVLSLEIVTADGRFVHANPGENEDLFWAIRGGGPSNFGVVTSAVVKAYDPVSMATASFNFQTGPVMGNTTSNVQISNATFWKGVNAYFSHLVRITDAKGAGWNYVNTQPPMPFFNITTRTFSFRGEIRIPGIAADELYNFTAPLIKDFNNAGINMTNPKPNFYETYSKYSYQPNGPAGGVGNGRHISRLFPRSSFVNTTSSEFNTTMAAIRTFVEDGGYSFHSVDYHPSKELAGYPGSNSAVNPHLRNAIIHGTGFDTGSYGPGRTPEEMIASHKRLNEFANVLREASPGSGAYMNEADTEEPNFQESFYGDNYERLLDIKKKRDPWSVFYAVTAVGSEFWEVEGTQGLPTQQGRLCRVSA